MKGLSDFRAGDELRVVRTCARYTPIYYAAVSGDFNPIHIDPEVGRLAGQPGAILQGLCTMAWMADACDRYFGAPGRATRLEARFAKPVSPGDEITFLVRCAAVEGGRVRVEVSARNQRGEDVLKNASAEAAIEAAPARSAEGRP